MHVKHVPNVTLLSIQHTSVKSKESNCTDLH